MHAGPDRRDAAYLSVPRHRAGRQHAAQPAGIDTVGHQIGHW